VKSCFEEVQGVCEEAAMVRLTVRAATQHLQGEAEVVCNEALLAEAMQEWLLRHCRSQLEQFEGEAALAAEQAEQDRVMSLGLGTLTQECEDARSMGRQAAIEKRRAVQEEAVAKIALEKALCEVEGLKLKQVGVICHNNRHNYTD
jgi:hypothetical protein